MFGLSISIALYKIALEIILKFLNFDLYNKFQKALSKWKENFISNRKM